MAADLDTGTTEPGGGPAGPAGRPDDATIRAELRERGHNPPDRARLGRDWVQLWESGETTEPLDDVTTAAAPPPPPAAPPGRAAAGTGERAPKRPTASGGLRERLMGAPRGGRGKGGAGRGRSGRDQHRPKHARVPVDRICGELWEFLARVAEPIDRPLSRCLHYQSDTAGLVLEDMVAGTLPDKILQPLARAEGKVRKGFALVGPPMLILALEQAAALPDPQRAIRLAVLIPMLREAMAQWVLVAGDKLEEKARRDAEMGPVMEQVDDLIQLILYGEPAPTPAGPAAAGGGPAGDDGDQAAAYAQQAATPGFMGFTAPPAPPPASPYAHPYAPVTAAQLARP